MLESGAPASRAGDPPAITCSFVCDSPSDAHPGAGTPSTYNERVVYPDV
jgi:hypothetical protein